MCRFGETRHLLATLLYCLFVFFFVLGPEGEAEHVLPTPEGAVDSFTSLEGIVVNRTLGGIVNGSCEPFPTVRDECDVILKARCDKIVRMTTPKKGVLSDRDL